MLSELDVMIILTCEKKLMVDIDITSGRIQAAEKLRAEYAKKTPNCTPTMADLMRLTTSVFRRDLLSIIKYVGNNNDASGPTQ